VILLLFEISTPDFLQDTDKATGEFITGFSCIIHCSVKLLSAYGVVLGAEKTVTVGVGTVNKIVREHDLDGGLSRCYSIKSKFRTKYCSLCTANLITINLVQVSLKSMQ